jgi:hypothetical protein
MVRRPRTESAGNPASAEIAAVPGPQLTTVSQAAGDGARIHHKYHDRTEDTVAVTRDDLREIGTIGWLQEGAAAIGLFFASGAFWLLMTLIAEHGNDRGFYPWYLACVVIVVCGAALLFIGLRLYRLRQQKIDKYLPRNGDQ